ARSGVFLPDFRPSPSASSPHPPACLKAPAFPGASLDPPRVDRNAPLPSPSSAHAFAPHSRPAAAPATEASAARNLSRFPAGSAEYALQTVHGIAQKAGPCAQPPLVASLRTCLQSPDSPLAERPRIRQKFAHPLPRSESPAPGFPVRSNP